MPRAMRTRKCDTCPNLVTKRQPAIGPVRCLDCTVVVMSNAALQMAAHQGDFYDRWVKSAGPQGRPATHSPQG